MINSLNMKSGLCRPGGVSALAYAAGYAATIGPYVLAGSPSKGGEPWLSYSVGRTGAGGTAR